MTSKQQSQKMGKKLDSLYRWGWNLIASQKTSGLFAFNESDKENGFYTLHIQLLHIWNILPHLSILSFSLVNDYAQPL